MHVEKTVCVLSLGQLFRDPMGCSRQIFPSMGFFRQKHRNGLPRPPPGGLPDPGIKPVSSPSPALAGGFFTTEPTEFLKQDIIYYIIL